jgi:hypothetical protein
MKPLLKLIVISLFVFSCKNETKNQITEIEILEFERYGNDTILPKTYNCVKSTGETFGIQEYPKNRYKYINYKLDKVPEYKTFENVNGNWRNDLPSIVGGAYCIKIHQKNKSSKEIYIENDKIYRNSSLMNFLAEVTKQNKLNRKLFNDTLTQNKKMEQLINIIIEKDPRGTKPPPPPIPY